MFWAKISKCISDLATKESKNEQEAFFRYAQVYIAH